MCRADEQLASVYGHQRKAYVQVPDTNTVTDQPQKIPDTPQERLVNVLRESRAAHASPSCDASGRGHWPHSTLANDMLAARAFRRGT